MNDTHSKFIGYVLWLFGFTGSHRFYYGKPVTGVIWFCTLGLLGIGWLIDLFLIPSMDRAADRRFKVGKINYSVAWILLTFFGLFGLHRLYMGMLISGLLFLLVTLSSMGVIALLPILAPLGFLVLLALLYDFCTLNSQIHERNCEHW